MRLALFGGAMAQRADEVLVANHYFGEMDWAVVKQGGGEQVERSRLFATGLYAWCNCSFDQRSPALSSLLSRYMKLSTRVHDQV